jgi:peroxiredoxin
LVELRDIHCQVAASGYQLLAISPDRPEKVSESVAKYELNFPALSDSQMTAARVLGIAYQVDQNTLGKLESMGIDLADFSGETHFMLPVPAVFVVGTNGRVLFEYVNPDYSVRLKPELLLAVVRADLK